MYSGVRRLVPRIPSLVILSFLGWELLALADLRLSGIGSPLALLGLGQSEG